jgi:hypothetical protein
MNELDQKIRAALTPDEAEMLRSLEEPSLWQQWIETFRGGYGWVNVLAIVAWLAVAVFAVVSAVRFFQAEGVREMLAWAGGFGLSFLVLIMIRLWIWMQLFGNAITREVKRVELLLARLSNQMKKPS